MKILQKKECITPPHCYLPILRATVIHKKKTRSVLTILDSGSELNVISTKLCNKLGLTGVPIVVNIIGVAANVTRLHTKLVDLTVEDRMGVQTSIECIVLDKTCGKALEVDPAVFETLEKFSIPEDMYGRYVWKSR